MCYVSFPHVTGFMMNPIYLRLPLTWLSPQFQIFVILIRTENTCLCLWMCVCVCLRVFWVFFGAFLGAGIVMFRANLPLHCTRNAHNVERGHRKGECEGGFKWLWRQHLTLTNINQIGGSLYAHRECTLLVIPCQHQGHSSYCIHICMSLDPMRVFWNSLQVHWPAS